MRRDVFQAIADPTRREIITMVARESLNLNAVASQFKVSRPAISKHIKILVECGLITVHQKGRERICEAKVQKLTEVSDWLIQFREMWEGKFDSLDNYLTELQSRADTSSSTEELSQAPEEEQEQSSVDQAPKMPEFLSARKKSATIAAEEENAHAIKPKPKAKSKTKTKKAKKKAKTPLLVGKVTAPEPEKKLRKKPAEPEKKGPDVAPNQYSLF